MPSGRKSVAELLGLSQAGDDPPNVRYKSWEDVKTVTIMQFPVVVDWAPAEVMTEIESALRECIEAVSEAHELIEKNRGEIQSLGDETRRLLAELKVA